MVIWGVHQKDPQWESGLEGPAWFSKRHYWQENVPSGRMGKGIIFWRNMFMFLVIYGPTGWHCTVHVSSNWSNTCTSGRFLRLHSILAESCAPRTTPLPGNSLYWANNLFRNFFIWIGITKDTQLYYLVAHFFVVFVSWSWFSTRIANRVGKLRLML